MHWSVLKLLFFITKVFIISMFRYRINVEVHNENSAKPNEREQRNKNVICFGDLDFERDDFFFILRALIRKSGWARSWNTDMPCIYMLDASEVSLSTSNNLIHCQITRNNWYFVDSIPLPKVIKLYLYPPIYEFSHKYSKTNRQRNNMFYNGALFRILLIYEKPNHKKSFTRKNYLYTSNNLLIIEAGLS